jgi:hypothetical protein
LELGGRCGVDLNAFAGGVDGSVDVDGAALNDDLFALSAGAEQNGVSSHQHGAVGIDGLNLHGSRVPGKVSAVAVVEGGSGIDLGGGLRRSVGNDKGGGAVGSVLGSVGDVEGSNCLVEVPLSGSEVAGGLLVGGGGVGKHTEGGLSGGFSAGELDGGFLELVVGLVVGLLGEALVVLGLGEVVLSGLLGFLGSVELRLGAVEVLVGSVVVLLGVLEVGVGLGFGQFLVIESGLGILEGLFSIGKGSLCIVELALSGGKVGLSLLDVVLCAGLVEEGEVELVLGVSEGLVGLGESGGSVFPVSVGSGGSSGSLVSIALCSSQFDVDGVIDALSVVKIGLGGIDSGKGIEELLVSLGLLGLHSGNVIDEGDVVADGHLVE